MSRSWKHNPFAKDNQKHSKEDKRRASRRIRRGIKYDDIKSEILTSSPSAYKKINRDTYDIHDYVNYWSYDDAVKYYSENVERLSKWYPTLKIYLDKCWAKYYKRK